MIARRIRILAGLFSLSATAALVACSSSPPPKKSTPAAASTSNTDTSGSNDNSASQSSQISQPTAAATATTPHSLPDASLPKPPPDAPKPPPPTTHNCIALASCCGNMPDLFQQLACGGTSVSGDETACQLALGICQGGGLDLSGITDLFGQSNPHCNDLAKCCDSFKNQGNTVTADDCSGWVEIQDETTCQTELQVYQSYGECQ
jgi:hypothetical protein